MTKHSFSKRPLLKCLHRLSQDISLQNVPSITFPIIQKNAPPDTKRLQIVPTVPQLQRDRWDSCCWSEPATKDGILQTASLQCVKMDCPYSTHYTVHSIHTFSIYYILHTRNTALKAKKSGEIKMSINIFYWVESHISSNLSAIYDFYSTPSTKIH